MNGRGVADAARPAATVDAAGAMEEGAPARGRRWPLLALRLAVAGGILAYLLTRVPVGEVASTMAGARPGWLLVALVLTVLTRVLTCARLRLFLQAQGFRLSTLEVLVIDVAAVFYGLFLPGGNLTAGAVRLYRLSRADRDRRSPEASPPGDPPAEDASSRQPLAERGPARKAGGSALSRAFAALLRDRLDATFSLLAVGLAFYLVATPRENGAVRWLLVLGLAAVCCLYALAFARRTGRRLEGAVERLRRPAIVRTTGRLVRALATIRHLDARTNAIALGLSVLAHLVSVITFWILAFSLSLDISVATLGWIRSAVLLLTLLPVSLGGLGVREAAFVFLLGPYDVAAGEALALSFLVFIVTGLAVGLAGGAGEAVFLLRRRGRRKGADAPR